MPVVGGLRWPFEWTGDNHLRRCKFRGEAHQGDSCELLARCFARTHRSTSLAANLLACLLAPFRNTFATFADSCELANVARPTQKERKTSSRDNMSQHRPPSSATGIRRSLTAHGVEAAASWTSLSTHFVLSREIIGMQLANERGRIFSLTTLGTAHLGFAGHWPRAPKTAHNPELHASSQPDVSERSHDSTSREELWSSIDTIKQQANENSQVKG